MFLLIAFGVAVHFKQHSSLTYQNSSFFIGGGSRNHGIMDLRDYGSSPIQRVVRNQPIANSSFYTLYTFYTKNITTLLHYILRTTDNGQRSGRWPELRNHGFTDLRIYGIRV